MSKRRARKHIYTTNLEEVQTQLRIVEAQNVKNRIVKFEEILNEVSLVFVQNLLESLNLSYFSIPSCNIDVCINDIISFISDFRGVRDRKSGEIVFSLDRGLCWLNGKRAPVYSKTLFIQFLDEILTYAETITGIFENRRNQMASYDYLCSCLRFQFLAAILDAQYTPRSHHANKKPLICTNALKDSCFIKKLQEFGVTSNVNPKQLPTALRESSNALLQDYLKMKINNIPLSLPSSSFIFAPQLEDELKEEPKKENDKVKELENKIREWEIKYNMLEVENRKMQNGLNMIAQQLSFLRHENNVLSDEYVRLKRLEDSYSNQNMLEILLPPPGSIPPPIMCPDTLLMDPAESVPTQYQLPFLYDRSTMGTSTMDVDTDQKFCN